MKRLTQRSEFKEGKVYHVNGKELNHHLANLKTHEGKVYSNPISNTPLFRQPSELSKYLACVEHLIRSGSIREINSSYSSSMIYFDSTMGKLQDTNKTFTFIDYLPTELYSAWGLKSELSKKLYLGVFKFHGHVLNMAPEAVVPNTKPYSGIVILPLISRLYYLCETLNSTKRAPKGYVIDYAGKAIKLDNAVKINSEWFEKNVSAVEVDGTWVINNPETVRKDDLTGKYQFINQLLSVAIGFKPNNEVINGWAKPQWYSNGESSAVLVHLGNGNFTRVVNREFAEKHGFTEVPNCSAFSKAKTKSELDLVKKAFVSNYEHMHPFNHNKKKVVPGIAVPLVTRKKINAYNQKYGMDSPTNILAERKNYTFGVELETSSGVLNPYVYGDKYNLKCVRDGSVQGGEYVTGVLYGDHGFKHLKAICEELSKRCTINGQCGVHVHIGNVRFTKELSINLSLLGEKIQDELFSLFPLSRRQNTFCTALSTGRWLTSALYRRLIGEELDKENYKALIHEIYADLYRYLSCGSSLSSETNRRTPHRGGHYAGGHGSARYNWLNLVTANFVQRQHGMVTTDISEAEESNPRESNLRAPGRNSISIPQIKLKNFKHKDISDLLTVEFRCHSASLNYYKIRNWVLICMGIVSFAEDRQFLLRKAMREGKSITLAEIFSSVYSEKTANMLTEYVENRKKIFIDSNPSDEDSVFTVPVESGSSSIIKSINI